MLSDLLYRLRALSRRKSMEAELDEELRAHVERQVEKYIQSGLTREEAMRRARLEFGGLEQVKEECRDARGVNFIETLIQDVRYGLRMLAKNPGFTAVAVLTLALGIGANTAIFTLVDAVMLKSLPVANPQELYRVGNDDNCCLIGGFQGNWGIYSYSPYQQFRDHTPEFSQMAAFQEGLGDLSVRRGGASQLAEAYAGEFVSGNYFNMFGVSASAGHLIAPTDDRLGAPPVAVMSYRA